MSEKITMDVRGKTLSIESGHLAKQATGSCLVRYGDTVVLAAVVAEKEARPDRDFFPLTVDYREKMYAAGKIPGGFFKREGRPTEKEILSCRLIDRSLRPLFPEEFQAETQVYLNVLSHDQVNDSDVLGLVAASAALSISPIPFPGPVGCVRVGKMNGELVVNPTIDEQDECTINLVVAGRPDSIVMVEGAAQQAPEAEVVEALEFAHQEIRKQCEFQQQIVDKLAQPKWEIKAKEKPTEVIEAVTSKYGAAVQEACKIQEKAERGDALSKIKEEAVTAFEEQFPENLGDVRETLKSIEKEAIRSRVLTEGVRADGRGCDDIRDITCEVDILPRTHGSSVFTRGQTQAMVLTTLGTGKDEQRMDALEGESWKSYMLHYNFPSFSVGEVRPNRGPGRREIGHGKLAERALEPVLPAEEGFPYTIRIVSEILESNGSSSMASVCGGSLSLMDAGVPIQSHVAGIAMGLIEGEDSVAVLTDILGLEDHLGDMDFKVTGTREGITAIQMDVKLKRGLSFDILTEALGKAKTARNKILDIMYEAMPEARDQLSAYAPRITKLVINPDKIRDVIGPGGKVIRRIQEETETDINIDDDGTVKVAALDAAGGDRAVQMIRALTEDPEIGAVYDGLVRRVVNFGAFVEILPNRDGLVHISELDNDRVARVEDVVREGDRVKVKVIGIDGEGKIKLSRKAVLAASE